MTRDDLQKVLECDKKGTVGPWCYNDAGLYEDDPVVMSCECTAHICRNIEADDRPNDMELIAAYRTSAPAMARQLLAIHEALDAYGDKDHDLYRSHDALIRTIIKTLGRNA